MKFKEYKIENFLKDLESDMPSPGGGSVSGLVAALAGGLNKMVYSLTIDKKSFNNLDSEKQLEMRKFDKKTRDFIDKSVEFMEEDRIAFNKLMDGYRLPKENKDRREIIKKETINAMNVPLYLCRSLIEFYENIEFAIKYGNKMLVSDAGVANILLNAAIESSVINVKINLNSLKQETFYEDILKEVDEILRRSCEEKKKIDKILLENM